MSFFSLNHDTDHQNDYSECSPSITLDSLSVSSQIASSSKCDLQELFSIGSLDASECVCLDSDKV